VLGEGRNSFLEKVVSLQKKPVGRWLMYSVTSSLRVLVWLQCSPDAVSPARRAQMQHSAAMTGERSRCNAGNHSNQA